MRVVSYGGGVQSTALLALAADRKIEFSTFLFANTGDDSEHPDTLRFVREVAMPFAYEHDIELIELRRYLKDGREETLYQRITKPTHKAITIPLRGAEGQPQSRHCTSDHKVVVVDRWLKANGASKDAPATVAIGISTDEIERAGRGHNANWKSLTYPLLDLGLNRTDCERLIRNAGLPVPPKSSCWFCPFKRPLAWSEMRRDEPDLFAASVALEGMVIARQKALGHPPLYLTRLGKPLLEAVAEASPTLFDGPEGCDEGYCWT